jgi:mono/diheme cytochrome c family protein
MILTATQWLVTAVFPLSLMVAVAADAAAASPGEVSAQRWCARCHGIRANEGSPNPDAPNFADIANEPSATRYSLNIFLRTSHPTMPNFVLSQEEIAEFVNYILSMKTGK